MVLLSIHRGHDCWLCGQSRESRPRSSAAAIFVDESTTSARSLYLVRRKIPNFTKCLVYEYITRCCAAEHLASEPNLVGLLQYTHSRANDAHARRSRIAWSPGADRARCLSSAQWWGGGVLHRGKSTQMRRRICDPIINPPVTRTAVV